jgi:hypothetical protein
MISAMRPEKASSLWKAPDVLMLAMRFGFVVASVMAIVPQAFGL